MARMSTPGGPVSAERSASVLAAVLLVAAGVCLWSGALFPFFNQDDFLLLDGARRAWTPDGGGWPRVLFGPGPVDRNYRPLSTFVYFGAMQRLFGLDPRPFHAISLACHLACGLLVYGILLRQRSPWPAAALGATFFLSRDAAYANLYWASAIQDVSMTLLSVAALAAWLEFMGNGRRVWLAMCVGLYAASLFCKETALALLPVFPLSAWLASDAPRRARAVGVAALVLATVPYLLLRAVAIGPGLDAPPAFRPGMILTYLGWLLDGSVYRPSPLVGGAVLAFLILWPLVAAITRRRQANANETCLRERDRQALVLAAAAWTLLGILPPLLLAKAGCQYYVYLPAAGMALFLGAAVAGLSGRLDARAATVFALLCCALFVVGASRTIAARTALTVTPGGFYHPANPPVNLAYLRALERRAPRIPDGATVYLAGYPESYALEGPTWEAIARLYFGGRFRVALAGVGTLPEGALVLALDEAIREAALVPHPLSR